MAEQVPAELAYLSNKRALIANPGTKYDSLYYSALNSTVQLVESVSTIGKWTQSLTLFGHATIL